MEKNRLTDEEREYLYWLFHVPGLGAVTIKKLWNHFGSFRCVYNIEGKKLRRMGLVGETVSLQFEKNKSGLPVRREELHELSSRGVRFLSFLDSDYPQRLHHIHDGPAALFVKGQTPEEHLPSAAIVGARGCTNYGYQLAEFFGESLSKAGVQIISGLALGVDSAGHRGALKAGAKTFGVLGCGIDVCYPRSNHHLYETVVRSGGLISEYPMGEQPRPGYFPVRNRIISGLSDAILVIEARKRSGSLITAELALDQGKEIFALPGRITDKLSEGCNKLIQDGAAILLSPDEILEYFGINKDKMVRVLEKNQNGLAKREKMVYSCLDLKPKFLDQIIFESGLSVNECMSALLELELEGYAVQISRQYYGKKI